MHCETSRYLKKLAIHESPNVTYQAEEYPIVFKKATGMIVTDVANKRYLDMTACFGVLALGHRHPVTLRAIRNQSAKLIHAMGDVHPSISKIDFLATLSSMLPYNQPQSILSLSGGEAIESALKTVILATGRSQFVSMADGYHGLQFGPLALNHRPLFTQGFENFTPRPSVSIPFPWCEPQTKSANDRSVASDLMAQHRLAEPEQCLEALDAALAKRTIAALVMEPLQGRGGERTYPVGFLAKCFEVCRRYGTLVIFDEIYTGLGRTGTMFAFQHDNVTPDILCLGKGLGGGIPLSACVADASLMSVWGKSGGEARHTSTFLGHPLACGVGKETLNAIVKYYPSHLLELTKIDLLFEKFCAAHTLNGHHPFHLRGRGWMKGFWFHSSPPGFAVTLAEKLLLAGFVLLPSGARGDVLSWTPPFIVTAAQTQKFLGALELLLKAS